MSQILITGGTGLLGKSLASILKENLLPYTLASRSKPPGGAPWTPLDLVTGEGIEQAVAGKRIIFHLASATRKPSRQADVEGTKRLLEAAAKNGVAHFIFISIVGIEKVPMKYYKLKLEAEREIIASGLPYSILRATQFHEFVDFLLRKTLAAPFAWLPKKGLVQPIETRAAAWKLFQLMKGRPLNGTVEIAGAEILTAGELAKSWLKIQGKRRLILNLPPIGSALRAIAAGGLTKKEAAVDCQTWQDWLAEKYASKHDLSNLFQL
ncbi:MAG: NAD(P)H-binding protein [Bacteroidota bacterium]